MLKLEELSRIFEAESPRFIREWTRLLSFPSISALPDHAADCEACAAWLVAHLCGMGLESRTLATTGHPVVWAQTALRAGCPTVLFYGHYDVQPVDPLGAWQTPPFEPVWRGNRLYARGAEDNKGQLFYFLKALETLLKHDALPVNVKILLDGEEENGSGGLLRLLPDLRERVRADVLMVCDTGMVMSGAPTIIMGLRGLIHLTAVIRGADYDLHSGVHGGVAPNSAQAMAQLAASLHDARGRVAVPGFYDGVRPPSDEEHALALAAGFNEETYRQNTGVLPVGGEAGLAPVDRCGFYPTIEINGMHSGFGGRGSKTIIPAEALLKISARMVAGQSPEACLAAIEAHLRAHVPAGLKLEITEKGVGGPGFRLDHRSLQVAAARDVLREVSGREPVFLWEGASIPIVAALGPMAGAGPLLVGFGREEDHIHAPNESFSLDQFRQGFLYAARILTVCGAIGKNKG